MRALRRVAAALLFISGRSQSARRDRSAEPALTGSACPPRGGPASRFRLPDLAGRRSGVGRALAGAFLLSLGALAALPAQAQTTPAIPNLTVTAVASSPDKLDVDWDEPTGIGDIDRYIVRWKTGGQSYVNTRQIRVDSIGRNPDTTAQITGLTANTVYDVIVYAIDATTFEVSARSEVTGTRTSNPPSVTIAASNIPITEGAGARFRFYLSKAVPSSDLWINYTVADASGGGDFLLSVQEGQKRKFVPAGRTEVRVTPLTQDDGDDEPNGQVTITLLAGDGYTLGTTTSGSVTVNDNDEPPVPEVAGLRVVPVNGSTTQLMAVWNDVTDAEKYRVRWIPRLNRGGTWWTTVEADMSHHTITNLAPGGQYTVRVVAIDTDADPDAVLARSEVHAQTNYEAIPNLSVTGSSAALDVSWGAYTGADFDDYWIRWKKSSESSYSGVWQNPAYLTGSTERRIRLTQSMDETEPLIPGVAYDVQVSAAKSLRPGGSIMALSEVTNTLAGTLPTVYVARANTPVTEGQTTWFEASVDPGTVAPEGGVTVNFTITDATGSSDFLDAADEGVKTVTIAAGENGARYNISTVNDDRDEPHGRIKATLQAGPGYVVGTTLNNIDMDIRDNDLPQLSNVRTQRVVGRTDRIRVLWNAYSGAEKYLVRWKTLGGSFNEGIERTTTNYFVTGLSPDTGYTIRVEAIDTGTGSDVVLARSEIRGIRINGRLTIGNLRVTAPEGTNDELRVTWAGFPNCTDSCGDGPSYLVSWRRTAGGYTFSKRIPGPTSTTLTGLAADTQYTVTVVAEWFKYLVPLWQIADRAEDILSGDLKAFEITKPAEAQATGRTGSAAADGEAAVASAEFSFTIYHDPKAPDGAVSRFEEAERLLTAAGRQYVTVSGPVAEDVDSLAGVENSVLPRFFLGNPAAEGWTSQPGVNNGGLRWLRSVLAKPEEAQPLVTPTPTLSIEAGPAVDEGTAAAFTVTLSEAAPAAGLTLAYSVSEDGAFVAASDEGAKTLGVPAGATSAAISVPTAGDADDEPDGAVTVTLNEGTGYALGDPSSAAVTVRDDDDAAEVVAGSASAFTIYHDPNGPAAAVSRYNTAVGLLDEAGQSYALRTVTGTATVDRLAGVSNSVLPRFFLGDPEGSGWTSQPGTNNGGLRWLRKKLAALAPPEPAVPALSVADASAEESSGSMAFTVTLSAAASESVSVDYATSNGTAVAGTDYEAASGTLTFAAGETSKTVTVTLLDDAHDEGTETYTLTLSNARPSGKATLADATATGSISNADPLQTDWLARFGRAAATDAIAAITARLETPRDAASHLTVGGHRMELDGSGGDPDAAPLPFQGPGSAAWLSWSDDPAGAESRTMSGRELLMGTSFRAVMGSREGSQWTSWGQGASVSQFSSGGPRLSLTGETATGSLGMDYEHGRLLTGFAMTHSVGEGTAHGAGRSYVMGSSVTTMLPYARLALSDRVSAWGLAGTGTGQLSLDLHEGAAERYRTDLTMTLAAMGVRGELLTPAEAGGFALALKADGFWVRTESDSVSAPGVGNLAGARADASRMRAVLDGSRRFQLADGATLTPSVELGLRHDGGDAETGTGTELGAGLGYADPSRGLDMALRVHGLASHAEDGYREWSVSGSLSLVPGGAGRGLSASLVPSYGADPGASDRLWTMPDAHALAANDDAPMSRRLDGELGYGIAMFGDRFTGTPNVGFGLSDTAREVRLGWRLGPAGGGGFELNLDAARREAVNDPGPGSGAGSPEHRIGVGLTARW
ncbi:MAG: fibronectin type III domain-containing protein [Defluviicoccus sp.]|nr:fibronectin type III domain-containing protein [Defluviicoccus sp.]MDE0275798.1 fibronectin type III domain-containing protein [Defluviicoccus sp.]